MKEKKEKPPSAGGQKFSLVFPSSHNHYEITSDINCEACIFINTSSKVFPWNDVSCRPAAFFFGRVSPSNSTCPLDFIDFTLFFVRSFSYPEQKFLRTNKVTIAKKAYFSPSWFESR